MKHLKLFFALFAMLALGVGNAWAESIEINTTSSGVNGSYRDYEFDVNSITFGCTQWMKNNNIQAKKSTTNSLYNVDAIPGTITSIVVKQTGTARAIKVYGGTSTKPNTQITSPSTAAEMTFDFTGKDYTYFSLTTPKNACYFDKITINYTPSSSGGDPEPNPDPTPDPEPEPEPDPTPGTSETWTLVTNTSDLKAGDIIVIASNTKGLVASNTITSGYMGEVSTTFSADKTTITTLPAEAAQLTIGGTSGAWTLTYNEKQLGATAVKKVAWDSGTKTWSITIANDGGATIQNGTSTYGRFLHNVSSTRFTTYTSNASSSMLLPQIYKKVTSSGETPETPTPSVSVAPTSHTFATTNVGETATQEFTITTENTTATLTASIDNTTDYAVSAIAGNKVTVTYQPQSAGDHTATMTIKAGEEASTTVALTGKAVAALEGTWILVTDASSLNVGDKIIIAAKESDVALSTTQADNNRPEVAITKNDNTITATSETQVLTLQAGNKENTLALYTGDGYLYAASSGSNWLRTETTLSDNSSWSIAVAADGTATLIAQGTNTRNTLYYNKNSKIFSCYSNAQQPIALYKNTNGKQLAGLAYATTKYLTKLGDAFTTPTLTNPNSLTVTYSSSDNNVATVDNTGTVTIKAAGVVVITAAFAGDASYLEGSAKYTLCVTEHAGTEADPYTVADARRVIDVMGTATDVYATGIVSEIVTAYNSTYGNITYNISIDGSTAADQLQAYRGKGVNGENFSSANDIKVGDEVIVKGNLKKHETTYEFDADNQLVSLKRDKQQAGLAYEEKEHTANVGEDFTEPTLTNPNSLTVTYSSSNTALATVDATTGEVSILAAGKVTITASSAADATYAAGSASYNITITDPSLAIATLPFAFNGNKAAIETTAGMTQNGLGSDYSASTAPNSQLKFDGTGDWVVIRFDSEPEKLSYDIKNNSFSGGKFSVQESADGETYTDVAVHTTITDLQSEEYELNSASRYVKFIYTTKSSGNVGLGNISITKADHRQEAGLAWNPATVSLTVGDVFTAPTFSKPNDLTGITFTSDNEALATVTDAGVISLVSGKTGIATITATYAGDETYKPAEATCVITVNPKSEKVVILAQLEGQWYAMTGAYVSGKTNVLAAIPVEYINGTLYNVAETDKASIEWQRSMNGNKATFKNGDNYLTGGTSTDLTLKTDAFEWDYNGVNYLSGNATTKRTFLYCVNTQTAISGFKNYAISNAGSVKNNSDGTTESYSSTPEVVTPVYATATIYTRSVTSGNFGTICYENNITNYEGVTFYAVAGREGRKVIFDEVTELEAGMPYLFRAEAADLKIAFGNETASEPGRYKSLQGTFIQIDPAEENILTGNYVMYNNLIKKCGKNCGLEANRAYFIGGELESLGAPAPQAPGRKRVSMDVLGENEATGVDNITENGVIAPAMQGTYDIMGRQLSEPTATGFYIVNGKKVFVVK